MQAFEKTIGYARRKDITDPLAPFRNEFHFPQHQHQETVYFCGNSLGLQPKNAAGAIDQELKDWKQLAIGGFYHARNPWLHYHQPLIETLANLAGASGKELTVLNALTVNLHFMLLSFYRPSKERYKIIMETGAFPSDQYAIETQVRFHGLDPEKAIIEVSPRAGEKLIREEDILQSINRHRDELALVLFGGINYYTGQVFDMQAITEAAHRAGAMAGFDLAHAMGNIPLQLHEWDVDFAVWCSYKYLNGGPGAVGGLFIHERYARNTNLNRLGGWWGNDEQSRFNMEKGFIPKPDASGWNQSTSPVFNMVCLKASLEIFKQTSVAQLRTKSMELTAYLEFLLSQIEGLRHEIITPADPAKRGAQLSLFFAAQGKEIYQRMLQAGIVVDYREPGVIRVAPAPLYNSFEDVWKFYDILNRF